MERIFKYTIDEKHENYTIERYLKELGYTHSVLVALKKTENGVTLNNIWAYVNNRLKKGDTLTTHILEKEFDTAIEAVDLPFGIVYEDEDILVVNKPSDMPIHPSINNHDNTLANALMYYYHKQNIPFTFRCINRLDRDTTGLSIIAKHGLSAAILGNMVSKREIHRTYLAICQGKVNDTGVVDAPIARVADSTIQREVNFNTGERAVTHYKLINYNDIADLSLVELKLETGRTHQIRVHMQYIGHSLIGDFLYNPDYKHIKRQALHSFSLEFKHPVTKKVMHLTAPLPEDMKCIFPFI